MSGDVLVTGATGFLGSHLVPDLEGAGFTVHVCNTSYSNLEHSASEIDKFWKGKKFRYIFHLAAVTKAGDYCLYHKGEQWIQNQKINTNILDYWQKYQPQAKMVAMGTSCSYSPDLPMAEENYLLGQPDPGLYTYAMTKRMLLTGLQSLEHQYGLSWLYFVPSTLYGPGFAPGDKHFIFDLIRKISDGKDFGVEVTLWGDGYQKRELIDVRDAVKIILQLLDKENEVFNLGSGQEYTIREYAEKISEFVGFDPEEIEYDTSKYVGVRSKRLVPDKLLEVYDGSLTHFSKSLEDAILHYLKS